LHALQLFDETTGVLQARCQRLEEVLTAKQEALRTANAELAERLGELASLRDYQERVFRALPSGVMACDGGGRITTINPTARALLGFLPGDRYPLDADPLGVVVAALQGRSHGVEIRLTGADGEERFVAARGEPLPNGEGAVATFADRTREHALDRALQRAERLQAIGEMAAGVAHEIRNPLNGIAGFAALMAKDLGPDHSCTRFAKAIVTGVQDLEQTVSGLLTYTGPPPPSLVEIDPVEQAHAVMALVQAGDRQLEEAHSLATQPVAIQIDDCWTGEQVAADPTQIRQILLNLVQNAAEFADRVRVRVSHPAGLACCRWTVQDNGPGIPVTEHEKIFQPFWTNRPEGTGLGLALAQALAHGHGGELRITNGDPDSPDFKGACFQLDIPCGSP
jgi:signal transduction histidine kinase